VKDQKKILIQNMETDLMNILTTSIVIILIVFIVSSMMDININKNP